MQKLIEKLLQNKKAISANQIKGKQTANLEQHLSNGQVLKDVLDDLTEEGQVRCSMSVYNLLIIVFSDQEAKSFKRKPTSQD